MSGEQIIGPIHFRHNRTFMVVCDDKRLRESFVKDLEDTLLWTNIIKHEAFGKDKIDIELKSLREKDGVKLVVIDDRKDGNDLFYAVDCILEVRDYEYNVKVSQRYGPSGVFKMLSRSYE